jgi:hypothetical protein
MTLEKFVNYGIMLVDTKRVKLQDIAEGYDVIHTEACCEDHFSTEELNRYYSLEDQIMREILAYYPEETQY